MTQNTKLGDMLLELSDPQLSEGRKTEIVRLLNELGDRENQYKSWLQLAGRDPILQKPTIRKVFWLDSPLQQYSIEQHTLMSTNDSSNTYITFDTFYGKSDVFFVDPTDATKIRIKTNHYNWLINGISTWAQNGTGYRKLVLEGYTNADVSLGGVALYTFLGHNQANNVFPLNFTVNYPANPTLVYFKMYAYQNSGGPLNYLNSFLSINVL